jgi:hypothetical protein
MKIKNLENKENWELNEKEESLALKKWNQVATSIKNYIGSDDFEYNHETMEYLTETLKIANDHIQDLSSESKVATDNFPNPTVGIIIDEHYFRILKARIKRKNNLRVLQAQVKALGYSKSDFGDNQPINLDLETDTNKKQEIPEIIDQSPTKYSYSENVKNTEEKICV